MNTGSTMHLSTGDLVHGIVGQSQNIDKAFQTASFYPISGADVISKWVGESERNIRQLFERARENRPSIVFIDEIDAIAGHRGEFQVHDSHVNQLLAEIDGVSGQRGVFVIGATNRPTNSTRRSYAAADSHERSSSACPTRPPAWQCSAFIPRACQPSASLWKNSHTTPKVFPPSTLKRSPRKQR